MAGANQSTRQKMIGMMYLVLTAILALNVSKDILNAFVVMNEGLELSISHFEKKNALLYADFDGQKKLDQMKVTPYWVKAEQVRHLSNEVEDYIQKLKIKLISETEGVPKEVADTLPLAMVDKKDNYDVINTLMIGSSEDGSSGLSRELKDKINEYRESLYLIAENESKNLNIGLETSDTYTLEDGKIPWEMHNFYYTPLAASVAILSQIQNDIRSAEFEVVNTLYKSFTKEDFKFDTIAAKVMAPTNYVLLGEDYTSDVFVAAFSTTQNPDVFVGEFDSLNNLISIGDTLVVHRGMGKYRIKTEKEGFHEYAGVINMKTNNGTKSYPFKSDYIVARPSLVVSPDKMNVLYKGIDNPVSVSVPGIPSENLSVSINGGNTIRKTSNGKYNVKMSKRSPRNVEIAVNAKLPSGATRNMGSMKFRVKNLPKPYAKIGSIISSGAMRRVVLASMPGIVAEYSPDFAFNLKCKVTGFKMYTNYKGSVISFKSKNNRFTKEMKEVIEESRGRVKIYFESIKAEGNDGVTHDLGTIPIQIF
ncbi:MAG: hypothetical protein COA57_11435 [Flavobacteriales bacterium]|nr:MAG: hypothetical protein COA57_11435 [Flavobacteriales bacterium]